MDMFTIPEALVCKNHYTCIFFFLRNNFISIFKNTLHVPFGNKIQSKKQKKKKKKIQSVNSAIKEV